MVMAPPPFILTISFLLCSVAASLHRVLGIAASFGALSESILEKDGEERALEALELVRTVFVYNVFHI